jgi:hypothetical protein
MAYGVRWSRKARRRLRLRRDQRAPSTWLSRTIIPSPQKGQQPVPSHDLTRFYALIPLLAILAALNPPAFTAVAAAAGLLASLNQLR